MSAETMRAAASLMRKRAEAVKAGAAEPDQWFGVEELEEALTWGDQAEMGDPKSDAQHIASWDPLMGLAVAELLEAGADEFDRREAKWGADSLTMTNPTGYALVNLARTYLGGPA